LTRNLIHSSYGIILKIRLVDYTLRRRNLAASHNTCSEHRGALELGAGCFWIDYQARIQNRIHARDPPLTVVIDLDLNDRCDIRQEALMRRNPEARSLAMLALSPPGFFCDQLCNVAETTGFPWVGVHRSPIVRILHTLKIDRARVPDQIEWIVERTAPGRMGKLIREALKAECVIYVGHRA